jgi:hypothetical protein
MAILKKLLFVTPRGLQVNTKISRQKQFNKEASQADEIIKQG